MANDSTVPVVVTTEFRGVFFGYVPDGEDLSRRTITLIQPRMCVSWSADVRGVLGLAATGPTEGCRITRAPEVIVLQKVSSVMKCTSEAAAAWEKAPWST